MRVAIVALGLTLVGCPPPKSVERPYAAPAAAELVAALKARAGKLRALQAETRVDSMGEKAAERVKVDMSFLVARGGKMRVQIEGPMGLLATFASDGKDFGLVDVRNNVYLHGPANACNVSRLLAVALEPDAAVDVLTGSVPLDGEPDSVAWDTAGREVLTLKAPDGGREVIKLDASGRRWDPLSAERTDASGAVLWRVVHEGFHDEKGGAGGAGRPPPAPPPAYAGPAPSGRQSRPSRAFPALPRPVTFPSSGRRPRDASQRYYL
jgi:hypothetical protein